MDELLPHKKFFLEDMEGEIWKDIKGFEGFYQISNFGRVKSCERYLTQPNGGQRLIKNKIMRSSLSRLGYLDIILSLPKKKYYFTIHRLVATHFIDNQNTKLVVNHINSVRIDNNINNLEWITTMENNCHRQFKNQNRKSNYIGVSLDKRNKKKKWRSQIYSNNKVIYLGCFKTELEAYQARCDYEKTNNIENKYL
jgi:hypothetical protein